MLFLPPEFTFLHTKIILWYFFQLEFVDSVSPSLFEGVFMSPSLHLNSLKFICKIGTIKPAGPLHRVGGWGAGLIILTVSTI